MADFVVLATADWDHPLWTNKQHTALTLAAAGHRVLYVESLGIRPPRVGASDRTRIVRRLRRMLQLPCQRQERLWVWWSQSLDANFWTSILEQRLPKKK